MKAIGIIAEYNPFHNGHWYHLQKVKEKYPDYVVVLVLSGGFTQRGDVSCISKDKKVKIALEAGVDLVVELPFVFATQSADYFSFGAISILEYLKVSKVVFGSESNNLQDLELIATSQMANEEFDKLVKIYSKLGNNYPTSLSLALEEVTGKKIATPNDLLGISYIKAIKQNNYKIGYDSIKRINNYHSLALEEVASASAVRKALRDNKEITNQVPAFVLKYLDDLHFINDYFIFLKYKVLGEDNLEKYQTVDSDLCKKIKQKISDSNSYEELVKSLKEKRLTENKIRRMLLHILCNFTKEEAKEMNKINYIRILGFNEQGQRYLNTVKKEIDVPLISKIKREKDKMLELELKIQKIYDIISTRKLDEAKVFPIRKENIND